MYNNKNNDFTERLLDHKYYNNIESQKNNKVNSYNEYKNKDNTHLKNINNYHNSF